MNSFRWDIYFETGIEDVDDQHQYLVEFINKYGKLLTRNTISIADIQSALFELSRYAEFHFKEEENLMREVGDSSRASPKAYSSTSHFYGRYCQHAKFY